jgi:serine/threonine-protein kinase
MLVGQQLGPFQIDKELGAGAMGAVYRARYVKTGQIVAVKVMAPGLGDNNPNAVARFEREAAILKQLNHPNIVRLFGVGKFQGTRYYAMEYIIGESLDRVMSRRGRMTWEEVVELGRQLCDGLQHAHEKGVVHRDLKPSNLMVLADGTLKLTDFGIAKDLDVTALTSANCTVGTASYMSPEQCKGERDIIAKSDLYSLGIVFYELITGRKPFNAENAMDMFLLHVQGKFERPSRIVLDMPIWMDNLICQMMEKKPEQRPLNAKMISDSLGSIQEKVEAQHSAGADAVHARMIDRPRGTRNPNEQDKAAARALTGKKGKRKRKRKMWYSRVWLQAAAILAILGLIGGLIVFAVQPPDPQALYSRAKKLMESSDQKDHDKANADDGPIAVYLDHYAGLQNKQTADVLDWRRQYAVECDEELLEKLANGKTVFPDDPNAEPKELALKAVKAQEKGDATEARRLWQEMIQKYTPKAAHEDWGTVAANHLAPLLDADLLYAEAKQLMKSEKPEDRKKACSEYGPIKTYLDHFDKRESDETKEMKKWERQCKEEEGDTK